jgi:hypothetical protein
MDLATRLLGLGYYLARSVARFTSCVWASALLLARGQLCLYVGSSSMDLSHSLLHPHGKHDFLNFMLQKIRDLCALDSCRLEWALGMSELIR